MKKIIILLFCLMLSIPSIAVISELYEGDKIIIKSPQKYELITFESEQEKYQREQLWKYIQFGFFVGMTIAGYNTRTDYGFIAGTGFLFCSLSIKFD